jgi:hypothetical protein
MPQGREAPTATGGGLKLTTLQGEVRGADEGLTSSTSEGQGGIPFALRADAYTHITSREQGMLLSELSARFLPASSPCLGAKLQISICRAEKGQATLDHPG